MPRLSSYGTQRNFVDRDHTTVSTLSPWMNKGLLAESELAHDALAQHPFSQVEKFLQEVYWRRYWRGYLSHRPKIWHDYQSRVVTLKSEHQVDLELIARGECSVEIMGYFARQLVETGYLHNHARMWFAAWWIHVEHLPWELGADFFLQHLIDGDPAVNTLSWRWVAGLHTQGKHYLARRSNLEKYIDPALLTEFAGGLELLENPEAQAVEYVVEPLELVREARPPSDYQGKGHLVVFPDDLDIERDVVQLAHQGVEVNQITVLENSSAPHTGQTRRWNQQALAAKVNELRQTGIKVETTTNLASEGGVIVREPEVGYYTKQYEALMSHNPSIVPYQDTQIRLLNSYAKAGFFTYWKKTKKHLNVHA